MLLDLPQIVEADKRNLIPVIDCKNNYMEHLQNQDDAKVDNAWEYYFKQPIEWGNLDDVYNSKNVYISKIPNSDGHNWNEIQIGDNLLCKQYKEWLKKYIVPQREITYEVEHWLSNNVGEKKILGVSIRSGYCWVELLKKNNAKGHPRVMECEYYLDAVERIMNDWGYDEFVLGIDDREWCDKFKEKFGKRCLVRDRHYNHLFKDGKPLKDEMEIHCEIGTSERRQMTTEYVIETYILSHVDSLYACRGSQGIMAYLLKDGFFKHYEFSDNGLI